MLLVLSVNADEQRMPDDEHALKFALVLVVVDLQQPALAIVHSDTILLTLAYRGASVQSAVRPCHALTDLVCLGQCDGAFVAECSVYYIALAASHLLQQESVTEVGDGVESTLTAFDGDVGQFLQGGC